MIMDFRFEDLEPMPAQRQRHTTNKVVRTALFEAGLRQYHLARMLGVSESRVSTMLRDELPITKQNELVSIIKKYEANHDAYKDD